MDEQEQEQLKQEDWERYRNKLTQKNGDFVATFGSERGVRALGYISDFCLEHACTFDEKSARKTDFNQGARSVILEIRHWLDMDISKLEKE